MTGLVVSALGCTKAETTTQAPEGLAGVVVPDEDFTFATSRAVALELAAAPRDGAEWVPVEVRTPDGQVVYRGAVSTAAGTKVRLPIALADKALTVIAGQGEDAVVHEIEVAGPAIRVEL